MWYATWWMQLEWWPTIACPGAGLAHLRRRDFWGAPRKALAGSMINLRSVRSLGAAPEQGMLASIRNANAAGRACRRSVARSI